MLAPNIGPNWSESWTVGGKRREMEAGGFRHRHAGSMTIVGSTAVLPGNRLTAGHFRLLEICLGCAALRCGNPSSTFKRTRRLLQLSWLKLCEAAK